MYKGFWLMLILFSSGQLFAQNNEKRKKIKTTRITKEPKIDGLLLDDAWKDAEIAKDFVIFRPDNGKAVSQEYQTEVKVVYDDSAIYIAATMLDPNPSQIPMEFAIRDSFSQADFFLVTINPNDDGQNPFEFIVQSTGNQGDAKVSNGNEDFNWSAVWESAAKITEKGWVVEIKIPYRALRFANRPVQDWGFNFHRRLENLNQQHTWNHIDNSIGIWTQYDGLIEDFRNIKPPTRLNLYPYASTTTDTYDGNTDFDWSLGMDIKYGLSENFTLDATLIPDFSQAGFDDVELNLGPFEQQFTEQRQFFTEGTELFSKGNLFYSRRIGSSPIDQFDVESQLDDNEEIIDSPDKVTMLNAIKVSGRTKKGLGIGVFNAITKKTEATIRNNITRKTRKAVTNPFSNYNIMVLDQQFNQNSAVTLINTNVIRDGAFRDANITGLLWHVETKDSKYNVDGSLKMSTISDDVDNPNTGYAFDTSIGKNSGKWYWELGYNFENKDYNPNDLGILFSNNEQRIYGNIGYRILKSTKNFNWYNFHFYNNATFQHFSGIYTGYRAVFRFRAQTKKRFTFGTNLSYASRYKDYFEPREGSTSGIYFIKPERKSIGAWISTNSQKKLTLNFFNFYSTYKDNPKRSYGFEFSPRYRFSNKFSLGYNLEYRKTNDEQGYVTKITEDNVSEFPSLNTLEDEIIFGLRNRKNYTNSISSKYNFSTKSSLSLTFRHYWSSVSYHKDFYNLIGDGYLDINAYSDFLNTKKSIEYHDINYNSWNIDLNYIWQFAPGSQLIALYRNSISNEDTNAGLDFFKNLDNLFEQNNQHIFSLRLVYFIDYAKMKTIF